VQNVERARQQVRQLLMGQGNVSTEKGLKHSGLANLTHQHQAAQSKHSAGFSLTHSQGNGGIELDMSPYTSSDNIMGGPRPTEQDSVWLGPALQSDLMRSCSLITDSESECSLVPRGTSSSIAPYSRERMFDVTQGVEDYCNRDFSLGEFSSDGTSLPFREYSLQMSSDSVCSVLRTKEAVSQQSSATSVASSEESGVGAAVTSSEESGVGAGDVDKTDSRYESRLERAVKLGYAEADLDKVIRRHGLDVDEDRLLKELIDSSGGAVDDPAMEMLERTEMVSPSHSMPDSASTEVFLEEVMKKVKAEDQENNLRHIVIDGSNVAMRLVGLTGLDWA
jgi:hypothetical protein